jgi:hypothetical protein
METSLLSVRQYMVALPSIAAISVARQAREKSQGNGRPTASTCIPRGLNASRASSYVILEPGQPSASYPRTATTMHR